MNIRNRLRSLERATAPPAGPPGPYGGCPYPYDTILVVGDAAVPPDVRRCSVCGEPHVLRVVYKTVTAATATNKAGRITSEDTEP